MYVSFLCFPMCCCITTPLRLKQLMCFKRAFTTVVARLHRSKANIFVFFFFSPLVLERGAGLAFLYRGFSSLPYLEKSGGFFFSLFATIELRVCQHLFFVLFLLYHSSFFFFWRFSLFYLVYCTGVCRRCTCSYGSLWGRIRGGVLLPVGVLRVKGTRCPHTSSI